jgi:hypothetical protein
LVAFFVLTIVNILFPSPSLEEEGEASLNPNIKLEY